jgi:hypothetical protein
MHPAIIEQLMVERINDRERRQSGLARSRAVGKNPSGGGRRRVWWPRGWHARRPPFAIVLPFARRDA